LTETALFVPFGTNKEFHLYQIVFYTVYRPPDKPKSWTITSGGNNDDFGKKLKELENYFVGGYYDKTLLGQWQLIGKSDKKHLETFTRNTYSVILGLFLGTLIKIRHRAVKKAWDTVTVTGTLDDDGGGYFRLKSVGDIDRKFKGEFLDNAQNEKDKKHLFIYISDEEDIREGENLGVTKNIQVKRFSPGKHSLDDVIDFLFEPYSLKWNVLPPELDEEQLGLLNRLEEADYVSGTLFEESARGLSKGKSGGCFIYGEGGSGKSAMAAALARRLLWEGKIYAPVWIRLNSTKLLEIIDEDKFRSGFGVPKNAGLEAHFRALISGKTENTDAHGGRKYLFVFDNLELKSDDLKTILAVIKKLLYGTKHLIIFTSRFDCAESHKAGLNLATVTAPEMQEEQISALVQNLSEKNNAQSQKIEEAKNTGVYPGFVDLLHRNFKTNPAFIQHIVFLLSDLSVAEAGEAARRYGQSDKDTQEKAVEVYKAVFSLLSPKAQLVFFAILAWTYLDSIIAREDIFEAINELPEFSSFSNPDLTEALKELRQSCLIYTVEDNGVTKYSSKNNIFAAFVLSDELDADAMSYRDLYFIPLLRKKLFLTIQLDFPPDFLERVIKEANEGLLRLKIQNVTSVSVLLSGETFFMHDAASYASDPKTLEILFQNGSKIDAKNKYGKSPFLQAVMDNENPGILDWFFEKEVNIHDTYDGQDALQLAAGHNKTPEIIRWLVQKGFTVDKEDYASDTNAFFQAALSNPNPKVLDVLYSEFPDFDINAKALVRTSYAIFEDTIKHEAALEALTEANLIGSDRDLINNLPILLAATINDNIDIAKWFLNHGAKMEKDEYGNPFFCAYLVFLRGIELELSGEELSIRFLELIDVFVEEGLDIHETNHFQWNAFHFAAFWNYNLSILDWLYEHNVDMNLKDIDGYSPFFIAVMYSQHPEILSWFIKQEKFTGFTDLTIDDYFILALRFNKEQKILQWFLENGANIDYRDKDGNTLLHVAALYGNHPENLEWLTVQGIDSNARNNAGKTAEYYLKKRKFKSPK